MDCDNIDSDHDHEGGQLVYHDHNNRDCRGDNIDWVDIK